MNTTPLATPTVSGDPYQERTWAGGVGKPGQFTFGPNGSSDVVEYVYSLNSGNYVTEPAGEPQAEQLTGNQQQVTANLEGFQAGNSVLSRSTNFGHDSPHSLAVTPLASGGTSDGALGDTYAAIGGDQGGMRLGMQAGKRYLISGWIYVPSATGLEPGGSIGAARGLRIVAFYQVGSIVTEVSSTKAFVTDGWQRLSVQLIIPAQATSAYVRLYNGFAVGSGKTVHWDDLSVREVVGTGLAVTLTPSEAGVNRLVVQSRNIAGNVSNERTYDFYVAHPPYPSQWHWALDENTGGIAASDPDDKPASLTPTGVSWSAPGRVGAAHVTLDGTGELTTSTPVLDTAALRGFTVAARVRLTDDSQTRTAVSQDGTQTSMFRLGFRDDLDVDGDGTADAAWCFSVASTDTTGADGAAACTTQHVATDAWVNLVGIYHQALGELRLYVNGTPDFGGSYVSVPYVTPWSAAGSFAIGRGYAAGPAQRWIGDLDDVYAASRVWSDDEILFYEFD